MEIIRTEKVLTDLLRHCETEGFVPKDICHVGPTSGHMDMFLGFNTLLYIRLQNDGEEEKYIGSKEEKWILYELK